MTRLRWRQRGRHVWTAQLGGGAWAEVARLYVARDACHPRRVRGWVVWLWSAPVTLGVAWPLDGRLYGSARAARTAVRRWERRTGT